MPNANWPFSVDTITHVGEESIEARRFFSASRFVRSVIAIALLTFSSVLSVCVCSFWCLCFFSSSCCCCCSFLSTSHLSAFLRRRWSWFLVTDLAIDTTLVPFQYVLAHFRFVAQSIWKLNANFRFSRINCVTMTRRTCVGVRLSYVMFRLFWSHCQETERCSSRYLDFFRTCYSFFSAQFRCCWYVRTFCWGYLPTVCILRSIGRRKTWCVTRDIQWNGVVWRVT